jgi:amino acid transporter, AAT family
VPAVVWIVVYAAMLLAVNFRQVGDYGRFEYWFAMVKVATIALFIVVGAALLTGGRVPAQYTSNGGFLPNGAVAPFKAVSFALFSFLGIEMVAISSGEARDRREIPRATRIMFALLVFVYVGAITVLVGVMPWHAAGVRQSPFVTVFEVAGIPAASTLMNIVVLTAALSGANANLYASARMLFSLARGGYAPAALGRVTAAGAPRNAVAVSATGILLAVLAQEFAPEGAYLYIIGASLFGGMLAWWVALAAHVRFRARLSAAELARLPMRSPGGAAASRVGFVALALAIASTAWVEQSRITIVSGGPYLLILSAAYVLAGRRKL